MHLHRHLQLCRHTCQYTCGYSDIKLYLHAPHIPAHARHPHLNANLRTRQTYTCNYPCGYSHMHVALRHEGTRTSHTRTDVQSWKCFVPAKHTETHVYSLIYTLTEHKNTHLDMLTRAPTASYTEHPLPRHTLTDTHSSTMIQFKLKRENQVEN